MRGNQRNLTEGVIWKALLAYALPVVLSSLLQSAYSLMDFILAGQFIGKVAQSAINNAGQIVLMLTQIIMGVTIGANILIGQYFGAKNEEGRRQTNQTLFAMSVVASVLMGGILLGLGEPILRLMKAPALAESTLYLHISAVGLLPVFIYNAIAAMLRGVGNSKQPLYFVAVTVVVNVVLDIIFMGVLHWDVAGAAWATVIAQTIACVVSLWYVLRHQKLYALSLRRWGFHKSSFRMILKLGIPSAIQMTIVGFSWLTMTFLINAYGVEASAASGMAARIKDMCLLFTIAMSSATSTMVAQCLGAEKYDRARESMYMAMRITVGVSVLTILLVEAFAPQLIALFHPDAITAGIAIENLRIEMLGQVFFAVFMVYHSLAMGAGDTTFTLFSSLLNTIVVRVALAVAVEPFFGLTGIFWACMIAPASSIPLGYWYERSKKWQKSLGKRGTASA